MLTGLGGGVSQKWEVNEMTKLCAAFVLCIGFLGYILEYFYNLLLFKVLLYTTWSK